MSEEKKPEEIFPEGEFPKMISPITPSPPRPASEIRAQREQDRVENAEHYFLFSEEDLAFLRKNLLAEMPRDICEALIVDFQRLVSGYRNWNRRDAALAPIEVREELRTLHEAASNFAQILDRCAQTPEIARYLHCELKAPLGNSLRDVFTGPKLEAQQELAQFFPLAIYDPALVAATLMRGMLDGISAADNAASESVKPGRPPNEARQEFVTELTARFRARTGDFPKTTEENFFDQIVRHCLECADFNPGHVHELVLAARKSLESAR